MTTSFGDGEIRVKFVYQKFHSQGDQGLVCSVRGDSYFCINCIMNSMCFIIRMWRRTKTNGKGKENITIPAVKEMCPSVKKSDSKKALSF